MLAQPGPVPMQEYFLPLYMLEAASQSPYIEDEIRLYVGPDAIIRAGNYEVRNYFQTKRDNTILITNTGTSE